MNGTIGVVTCMQVGVSIKSNDPFPKAERIDKRYVCVTSKSQTDLFVAESILLSLFSQSEFSGAQNRGGIECVTDLNFRARGVRDLEELILDRRSEERERRRKKNR